MQMFRANQWPSVAILLYAVAAVNAVIITLSFDGGAPLYPPVYRIIFLMIGWVGIWRMQRWYAGSEHFNAQFAAVLVIAHVAIAAFTALNTVIFILYFISVH